MVVFASSYAYVLRGNINDSKMLEKATENMKGWFYCDAGYLKRREELVRLARWMAFSSMIEEAGQKELL